MNNGPKAFEKGRNNKLLRKGEASCDLEKSTQITNF
jgi:hypothetical protein